MPGISSKEISRSIAQVGQSRFWIFRQISDLFVSFSLGLMVGDFLFKKLNINILIDNIKLAGIHSHGTTKSEKTYFIWSKLKNCFACFW